MYEDVRNFMGKLLVGVIVSGFVIAFFTIPFTGLHIDTGSGSQVGYVSAVEKSGLIFKTYTAYIKPELESTQEDTYCVMDESVAEALRLAAINKQRVEVRHNSFFATAMSECNAEPAIINTVNSI
jgi:hypothetical protein